MADLADQLSPRLTISDNEPPARPVSPGFFSKLRHGDIVSIRDTLAEIRQQPTLRDLELGAVYVAKEMNTDFIKVGYAMHRDATRVRDVATECGVSFEKTYRTPLFYCAHRTEQIVHKILSQEAYPRYGCECEDENHEWYEKTFDSLITLVNLVRTWTTQKPYDLGKNALKDEWETALCNWENSQKTPKPLAWSEFFLMGLELSELLPTSSPLGRRHNYASTTNLASATTPSPRFRKTKNPPSQPPSLCHANSPTAGLQVNSCSAHSPSTSAISSSRPPSTWCVGMTKSKVTSRPAPNWSPIATPGRRVSSKGSPIPELGTTGESLDADYRGEVVDSNDDQGSPSDLFKTKEKPSIAMKDTTAEEHPTVEAERKMKGCLRAEKAPIVDEDPREEEALIPGNGLIGSESMLSDEESADDEDSKYQYDWASDEESGIDTERMQEELAMECRELAEEEELLALHGNDFLVRLRADLAVEEPGFVDEGEPSSEIQEEDEEEEEEEEEGGRGKEREEGEGKEKEKEEKEEEQEEKITGEEPTGPESTWHSQTKALTRALEAEPVAKPDVKQETGSQNESTADAFTIDKYPENVRIIELAIDECNLGELDKAEDNEHGRPAPSTAQVKGLRRGEGEADQGVVNASRDDLVSIGQEVTNNRQPSAPLSSASGTSPYQAVPPGEGTGVTPFQPANGEETNGANISYQSIAFQQPNQKYSSGETRLGDYGAGRRFGNGSNGAGTVGASHFGGAGSRSTQIPQQEVAIKEGYKISPQNTDTVHPGTPPTEPLPFRCRSCRQFDGNIISPEKEEILRSGGEISPPPQCVVCRSSCPISRYLSKDTDPPVRQIESPTWSNQARSCRSGPQEYDATAEPCRAIREPTDPFNGLGGITAMLPLSTGLEHRPPERVAGEKVAAVMGQAVSQVPRALPVYSFRKASAESNMTEFTVSYWDKTDWTSVFGGVREISKAFSPEPAAAKATARRIIKWTQAGKMVVVKLPPTA